MNLCISKEIDMNTEDTLSMLLYLIAVCCGMHHHFTPYIQPDWVNSDYNSITIKRQSCGSFLFCFLWFFFLFFAFLFFFQFQGVCG